MAVINTTAAYAFAATTAVSTTVLALEDLSPLTADEVQQAQRCRITCNAQGIYYRYDGGDPTTSEGHFLAANAETLLIGSQNIRNLRIIRSGGTNAAVAVTLEK